jgi:hypothetical protein
MKTNAEKQADRRKRLSCDGLFKRRDLWCHPDDEPELRRLEKKLQNKRKKQAHNAIYAPIQVHKT